MKVVVTGASGYIGRHVVDALIKMHHEVIAVDRFPKKSSLIVASSNSVVDLFIAFS